MSLDPDDMIAEYMPLAASLAQQTWRTAPHALELDELRGIAYLGLVCAAKRWLPYCAEHDRDPWRLEFFRPFVVRRVKGALIDAIRASDWAGRNLRARAKALAEASGGRSGVAYAELAERTGMSVTEVRSTVRDMASQKPLSIEAEELDPGAVTNVESSVLTRDVLRAVVTVYRALDPEHQVVLALHYHQNLQLQHVARQMGVTEARASQLHAEAVLALHSRMTAVAQEHV